MWIARDKDGELILYVQQKPFRFNNERWEIEENVDNSAYNYIAILDKTMFPDLRWEDEPVEMILFPMDVSLLKPMTQEEMDESIDNLPIQCRLCSVHRCMEPKGKEVCEFYRGINGDE